MGEKLCKNYAKTILTKKLQVNFTIDNKETASRTLN